MATKPTTGKRTVSLFVENGHYTITLANVGPQGPTGDTGPQGIQGEQGIQGDQGVQGIQGIQGEVGPIGTVGPQGDIGPQGIQGIQGEVGAEGPIGPQGDQGIQGIQGDQGEIGPQGPIGLDGPQGIPGDKGDQGDIGPHGPIGPPGPVEEAPVDTENYVRKDAAWIKLAANPEVVNGVMFLDAAKKFTTDAKMTFDGLNFKVQTTSPNNMLVSTGTGPSDINYLHLNANDTEFRIGVTGSTHGSAPSKVMLNLGTPGYVEFRTNNLEAIRINNNRSVSIGTTVAGLAAGDLKIAGNLTAATITASANLNLGESSGGSVGIELANGRTIDGPSFIDFHGSTPAVDFDTRMIRYGGVNGAFLIANQGTGAFIIQNNNGSIGLATGGIERLNIVPSGFVGIGNTNPTTIGLTIGDSTRTGENYLLLQSTTNLLYLGQSAGTVFGQSPGTAALIGQFAAKPLAIGTNPAQPLILATADSERLRISPSGNVGVGTTTTDGYGLLQVNSTTVAVPVSNSNVPAGFSLGHFGSQVNTGYAWIYLRGPYNSSGHRLGILLQDTYYDNNQYGGRYIQAIDQRLVFGKILNGTIGTSNAVTYEHLSIDTSGNIGMGTTVTPQKLNIVSGADSLIALGSSNNLSRRGLKFTHSDPTTEYGSVSMDLNSGEIKYVAGYSGWGGRHLFFTDGLERMRLSSVGGMILTNNVRSDYQNDIEFVNRGNGTTHGESYTLGGLWAQAWRDTGTSYTAGIAFTRYSTNNGLSSGSDIVFCAEMVGPATKAGVGERMRITAQAVFIGTNIMGGSSGRLQILENDNKTGIEIRSIQGDNTVGYRGKSTVLLQGSGSNGSANGNVQIRMHHNDYHNLSGDISFWTKDDNNTLAERVRIGSKGTMFRKFQYSGNFATTPTTIVDLNTIMTADPQAWQVSAAVVDISGIENIINVSYGQWMILKTPGGYIIKIIDQIIAGNSYGTCVPSINGSLLQVISGAGAAVGGWQAAFNIINP